MNQPNERSLLSIARDGYSRILLYPVYLGVMMGMAGLMAIPEDATRLLLPREGARAAFAVGTFFCMLISLFMFIRAGQNTEFRRI